MFKKLKKHEMSKLRNTLWKMHTLCWPQGDGQDKPGPLVGKEEDMASLIDEAIDVVYKKGHPLV